MSEITTRWQSFDFRLVAITAVLLAVAPNCFCEEPRGEVKKQETRLKILVDQIEDTKLALTERVEAARELGEMSTFIRNRGKFAIPRLIALLPGDWDALTRQIVEVLREIGDRRAIPSLKAMVDPPNVYVHSKLHVSIEDALKTLQAEKPSVIFSYTIIPLPGGQDLKSSIVFVNQQTKVRFTEPFGYPKLGEGGVGGSSSAVLPEKLVHGRYHIFLEFNDGKHVRSTGHYFVKDL